MKWYVRFLLQMHYIYLLFRSSLVYIYILSKIFIRVVGYIHRME